MSYGSSTASSEQEICALFADHFSNAYSDYINDEELLEGGLSTTPRDVLCSRSLNCTVENVGTAILSLKPSYSPGPDGIPAIILKKCTNDIAPIMTFIFNLSFQHKCFPALFSGLLRPI